MNEKSKRGWMRLVLTEGLAFGFIGTRFGDFSAIAFFLCIYMARINYYIQTVFQQLLFYLGDYGLARAITRTFTVLLPLGGIAGKYSRARRAQRIPRKPRVGWAAG